MCYCLEKNPTVKFESNTVQNISVVSKTKNQPWLGFRNGSYEIATSSANHI